MALNKNAKKWVAALRSGKYQQAKKTLATTDGRYCCLGVACEVYIESGNVLSRQASPAMDRLEYGIQRDGDLLPTVVQQWLGLSESSGVFYDENGRTNELTDLNDSGQSFEFIADIIESEPDGLFTAPVAVTASQPPEQP